MYEGSNLFLGDSKWSKIEIGRLQIKTILKTTTSYMQKVLVWSLH